MRPTATGTVHRLPLPLHYDYDYHRGQGFEKYNSRLSGISRWPCTGGSTKSRLRRIKGRQCTPTMDQSGLVLGSPTFQTRQIRMATVTSRGFDEEHLCDERGVETSLAARYLPRFAWDEMM